MPNPIDIEGFTALNGGVVYEIDTPSEQGRITFISPFDRKPTWTGELDEETVRRIVDLFHELGWETRERLFGN